MPLCYLCDRLDREGADRYPQGRDKATGRPVVAHVYPSSLRVIRHVCDAPTQGERANSRRAAAAELELTIRALLERAPELCRELAAALELVSRIRATDA